MACNIKSTLIIFLILPLTSGLNPFHFLAKDKEVLFSRRVPDAHLVNTLETSDAKLNDHNSYVTRHVKVQVQVMGSRPPRCDNKDETMCKNCGQCEAVQVPISVSPTVAASEFSDLHRQQQQQKQREEAHSINSRGDDDISNYKPMCWKCKCGDFIFNP